MNTLDQRWLMVRDRWPVRVKNGSGAAIPPFSIVLISSSITTNNEIVFTVAKPNAASTDFNWDGYLVTGPFAIGSGSSDEGLATTLAQPNFISTDFSASTGNICGPKHNQFTAAQYYYGYHILGGATTFNSVNIAIARWIGVHSVLGKTDGASTKGSGTVTVSVYAGAVNSDADTTMNITGVGNEFADVETTKYVWVTRNGGVPYLTSAEC
jgi:hypothetical protein